MSHEILKNKMCQNIVYVPYFTNIILVQEIIKSPLIFYTKRRYFYAQVERRRGLREERSEDQRRNEEDIDELREQLRAERGFRHQMESKVRANRGLLTSPPLPHQNKRRKDLS